MMIFVASLIVLIATYNAGFRVGFKSRTVLDTNIITSIANHQAVCIEAGDDICIKKSNEMILNMVNVISENWPKEALEMKPLEIKGSDK